MDIYNSDEFTPNPGVIPLAWQVRYDDDTIRGWGIPPPGRGMGRCRERDPAVNGLLPLPKQLRVI